MLRFFLLSSIFTLSINYVLGADFRFSHSVPYEQKEILEDDFKFLLDFEGVKCDEFKSAERLCDLYKIDYIDGYNLTKVLKERVKYILGENEVNHYSKILPYEKGNLYFFPYIDIYPYVGPDEKTMPQINEHPSETIDGKKIVIVMANIGAELYLNSKFNTFKFNEYPFEEFLNGATIQIPLLSPRVGIIQIGEGLFSDNNSGIVARINRLATFFHESRHSDGRKESLAFTHSKCPKGHDYEYSVSCDHALNGSYSFDSALIKFFIDYFKDRGELSTEDESALMTLYYDIDGRIIKSVKKIILSPENEKLIAKKEKDLENLETSLVNAQHDNLIRAIMRRMEKIEKEIEQIRLSESNLTEMVPAKNWDDEPESAILK